MDADRESKRLIRLLGEDVTLNRAQNIILQVRFRGGAAKTLTVPLPRKRVAAARNQSRSSQGD